MAVGQAAYRELFKSHLDNDMLHEIRESLNHELVLGKSYFKDKIQEITNSQMRLGTSGRSMSGEESATYAVYYYIRNNCSLTHI